MYGILKKDKSKAAVSEAPANALLAAQNGTIIPIEKLPDPVFSGKVLGDGYAIDPTDGKVLSPVSGTIVDVQDTLHAYCLETDDGLELLVHIGINTVELKGEGFRTKHKTGDRIRAGELLVTVDLALLRKKQILPYTIVLISNVDELQAIHPNYTEATAGQTVALTYEK